METLPIFNQTHELTPLKKYQFFFDFIKLFFLLSTKVFSVSRILSNKVFSYFFAEIKDGKIANF